MDTEQWGIDAPLRVIRENVWAAGDDFILKAGDPVQLKRHIEILGILQSTGIPVSRPIPTKAGKYLWISEGTAYMLTTCLKGSHVISIYSDDGPAMVYTMGQATSRLHKAFKEIESRLELKDISLIEELQGWIPNVLQEDHWRLVSQEEYLAAVRPLEQLYLQLPKQLIHRDLHFGNVLFEGTAFTGYIDFDLSRHGARMFDLCYFLLGLLQKRALDRETLQLWLYAVEQFLAGYQEIQLLQPVERRAAVPMMACIGLLFAAFYISQKMPEAAAATMELYRFVKRHEAEISACF